MSLVASRALAALFACVLVACSPKSSTAVPPAAGTGAAPTSTSPPTVASGETTGAATAASGTTGGTAPEMPEIKESDCPPRCSESGAWVGCGLEKPRGKGCGGCAPKCKSKGSAEEGWYDCTGVFIASAKCGG